jgi:HAD superfamily hydrolase (TIGR01509 family)
MAGIKALVFDFDGVVVDTEALYDRAERELFAMYGVDIGTAELREVKGLSEEIFLKMLKTHHNVTAPMEEIKVNARRILRRIFAAELNYMPGFPEFYAKVKHRFKTGLVTSSSRELLDWIFAHTPIDQHFQSIVTTADTKRGKPFPDPYLRMCQMLEVVPEDTIVIEDSLNGVQSARAANTITIGFLSSFSAAELAAADYTVANYEELESLLPTLIQRQNNK